jgi:TIR domain-containing protein
VLPLLFNRISVFDVLQHQEETLKGEVAQLTSEQIESEPEDELVRDLAGKYKLETPVLEDEKAHISYREVNVDVSQDPMRMIWDRSRPFYIKGTEITFTVPFKGEPNLFQVRPTTFTTNPPRGEIRGREIHLVQTRTDDNAAAAKIEYERSLQTIKQYLGWLGASISDFNSKIGSQVQGLVNQRRQQLAARAGMVEAIGLPIKTTTPIKSDVRDNPTRTKSLGKSLGSPKKWDVFISHATEDKDDFVRPLARALRDKGVSVWFDEFSLKMGDSLRASIDFGLANSRYGVVVLSKNFFGKHWPIQELNGLSTRENVGKNIILPIWHKITHEEVKECSPMLADKLAVSSELGIEAVVKKIVEVLDEQ